MQPAHTPDRALNTEPYNLSQQGSHSKGHLKEPELESSSESFSSFLLALLISSTANISGQNRSHFLGISKYNASVTRREQGAVTALGRTGGSGKRQPDGLPRLTWLHQGERIQVLGETWERKPCLRKMILQASAF